MKDKARERANLVVKGLVSPVEKFLAMETSSGILLIITTLIALIWANSPWHESYEHFIHFPVTIGFGEFVVKTSLHHSVNDALMVIFFFVVGLEIKRELFSGELSTPKKAALPMLAALGGMIAPAIIYAIFNHNGIGKAGWGIPMATDIAFAVGVLTLLSRKVPFALKVFLLALAIVDDLGAVLVIALFYTNEISGQALGIAALSVAMISLLTFSGVRKLPIYLVLSFIVWLSILQSGVHATIAGVIIGFLTPLEPFANKEEVLKKLDSLAATISPQLAKSQKEGVQELTEATKSDLEELSKGIKNIKSPLDRLIHGLHPWVSYFIMPIFALANAGVHINGEVGFAGFFHHPISLGIILGLFLGKPIGVIGFSFLAVKMKWASLPKGVNWYHITCVGFLAGIGFTMALFVSNLALTPELETYSKVGILLASVVASLVGIFLLNLSATVPEAERRQGGH